jgi:dTDP-4-amino-4,6-dideoxygalactose transaminase
MKIPFNLPLRLGTEIKYLQDAVERQKFSAKGYYGKLCSQKLQNIFSLTCKVYLTSSCTAAMEMAVLLLEIKPDDEVIMPSFTHVGTANPFLRAGAKIVWCDIDARCMSIDPHKIEELITSRTKAIIAVHYAGIPCKIDEIRNICNKHNLFLVEDCAMSIGSSYKDKSVGTFGNLAVVSFHETKNIHCGEGGAIIINNENMLERAEILMNCGTNKNQFESGKTDHYSWISNSSNFKMSELQAAFLFPQLQELQKINSKRIDTWNFYYNSLSGIISKENLPSAPKFSKHNGHLFYIHTGSRIERNELISFLKKNEIEAVFHYIPLHNAPIWNKSEITLPITEKAAGTILRMPLYYDLSIDSIVLIAEKISEFYSGKQKANS